MLAMKARHNTHDKVVMLCSSLTGGKVLFSPLSSAISRLNSIKTKRQLNSLTPRGREAASKSSHWLQPGKCCESCEAYYETGWGEQRSLHIPPSGSWGSQIGSGNYFGWVMGDK